MWTYPTPTNITSYANFDYTMVIPQFYWDVESPEQRIKYLCMLYGKLVAYIEGIDAGILQNANAIKELQDAFQKFVESGFDDYYAEQVAKWIGENLNEIMDAMTVSTVYFGLTDDGFFTAYYPLSWKTVQFDTFQDYSSDYYGHLVLSY